MVKVRSKKDRKEPYWKELNKIIDPEIQIGIVDLGLIYEVKIKNNHAQVIMTLTTPTCPMGPMLIQQVEDKMRLQKGIKSVEIKLIWDPPWDRDMIDPDIKDLMFGF